VHFPTSGPVSVPLLGIVVTGPFSSMRQSVTVQAAAGTLWRVVGASLKKSDLEKAGAIGLPVGYLKKNSLECRKHQQQCVRLSPH
jgi:hypothetical protein